MEFFSISDESWISGTMCVHMNLGKEHLPNLTHFCSFYPVYQNITWVFQQNLGTSSEEQICIWRSGSKKKKMKSSGRNGVQAVIREAGLSYSSRCLENFILTIFYIQRQTDSGNRDVLKLILKQYEVEGRETCMYSEVRGVLEKTTGGAEGFFTKPLIQSFIFIAVMEARLFQLQIA